MLKEVCVYLVLLIVVAIYIAGFLKAYQRTQNITSSFFLGMCVLPLSFLFTMNMFKELLNSPGMMNCKNNQISKLLSVSKMTLQLYPIIHTVVVNAVSELKFPLQDGSQWKFCYMELNRKLKIS